MPMTVITLSKVSNSLKGDLSKWMQEIATGVYIGNFNSKVRDKLWERIQDAVGTGEATISYPTRNEIGYTFLTVNSRREIYDSDGIPLVCFPLESDIGEGREELKDGFSNATKFYKARKFAKPYSNKIKECYVFLDLETDGLNEKKNRLIEVGAVKVLSDATTLEYQSFFEYDGDLPKEITELTGITTELLQREGRKDETVLKESLDFLDGAILVGYNIAFDLRFLSAFLQKKGMNNLKNSSVDLMRLIKKEKPFQKNYKLETSLQSYGIQKEQLHRALEDAKLTYELATKVNGFCQNLP